MKQKFLVLFLSIAFFLSALESQKVLGEELTEDQKNFSYAEALFNAELYEQALENYLKVLHFFPKSEFIEVVNFKIGKCYQRLNKFWLAIAQFESFMKKYPESKLAEETKREIELTRLYIQNRDIYAVDMADFLCDEYINRGNEHINRSEKTTTYGKLYIEEEFKTGIYWFKKAIAEFPNSPRVPRALYDLASAYRRTDRKTDYETAIAELQKLVDNYPNTVWDDRALIAIGDIYKDNLQNNKKAVEAYQKVIEKYKGEQNNYFVKYAEAQIEILGGAKK